YGLEELGNGRIRAVGVDAIIDKTDFKRQVGCYLPDQLGYEVVDCTYETSDYADLNGKVFRLIVVEYDPKHLPYMPKKESSNLKLFDVYVRNVGATERANYAQMQDIFNRRIESHYSSAREISLQEHLAELKLLFEESPSHLTKNGFLFGFQEVIAAA